MRVAIACDYPIHHGESGEPCGLVAVGLHDDGRFAVIEDASLQAHTPRDWGRACVALAASFGGKHFLTRIVIEGLGAELARAVIHAAGATCPVDVLRRKVANGAWIDETLGLFASGRLLIPAECTGLLQEIGTAQRRFPERGERSRLSATALAIQALKPRPEPRGL